MNNCYPDDPQEEDYMDDPEGYGAEEDLDDYFAGVKEEDLLDEENYVGNNQIEKMDKDEFDMLEEGEHGHKEIPKEAVKNTTEESKKEEKRYSTISTMQTEMNC